MVSTIIANIGTCFSNALAFLLRVLDSTHMNEVLIGGIAVALIIRFILSPIFGGATADNARSIRGKDKGGK